MKKTLSIIIAIIIVGSGSFYGGIKYQQNKSSLGDSSRQNFQNLSAEQRQQTLQGNIVNSFGEGGDRMSGQNFLTGEVIAKDEESLTLKIPEGGSKIIFLSDSTQISKTTYGSISDIEIAKQIIITGEQNSDGIYTAKTIQLTSMEKIDPVKNE